MLAAGMLTVLVWGGCSVEKHYALLSFFFDGVPEPATPEEQALAQRAGERPLPGGGQLVSAHTAFLDRRCAECHGDRASFGFTTTGFSDLDARVCAKCHAGVEQAPHPHGPVAAGVCLACHDPHASRYPLLLVDTSPALCLSCHQHELEGSLATPIHADLSRDCLECHNGHGSDRPYLLRPPDTWAADIPPPPPDPAEPET